MLEARLQTMGHEPLRVGLACNRDFFERDVDRSQIARLEAFAEFRWHEMNEPTSWDELPAPSAAARSSIVDFARELDVLLVCHGAPRITADILAESPRLKLIGELEGDRFAGRIDVSAATDRGVRVVDTTHGTSAPVAEWALGLILIAVRNAGALFRSLIGGTFPFANAEERRTDPGFTNGELTGKRVGLIGCGHIGRRLITFLKPFDTDVWVHDPYVPKELAQVLDVTLTSLHNVLSKCDIVVCLVPLTPATEGMLGEEELELLRPGAVLVNVSRGKVVRTDALLARLDRGDVFAGLDVFDPEPIPLDSPILRMPNAFLTPHVASTAAGRLRLFSLMVDELERFAGGHETLHDLSPRVMANRRGEAPPPR